MRDIHKKEQPSWVLVMSYFLTWVVVTWVFTLSFITVYICISCTFCVIFHYKKHSKRQFGRKNAWELYQICNGVTSGAREGCSRDFNQFWKKRTEFYLARSGWVNKSILKATGQSSLQNVKKLPKEGKKQCLVSKSQDASCARSYSCPEDNRICLEDHKYHLCPTQLKSSHLLLVLLGHKGEEKTQIWLFLYQKYDFEWGLE